jgi:pimeloyl-ACP methyl ester carboxylesterase
LCREIPAAGHFVQEDQPELLAAVVLDVLHYLETRG